MKVKSFNCSGCEYLSTRRVGDSFDRADELKCSAMDNRMIDSYCDAKDFPPKLPNWCPRINI